jgi:hypothetical protein
MDLLFAADGQWPEYQSCGPSLASPLDAKRQGGYFVLSGTLCASGIPRRAARGLKSETEMADSQTETRVGDRVGHQSAFFSKLDKA